MCTSVAVKIGSYENLKSADSGPTGAIRFDQNFGLAILIHRQRHCLYFCAVFKAAFRQIRSLCPEASQLQTDLTGTDVGRPMLIFLNV